jgi:hypothetical protein
VTSWGPVSFSGRPLLHGVNYSLGRYLPNFKHNLFRLTNGTICCASGRNFGVSLEIFMCRFVLGSFYFDDLEGGGGAVVQLLESETCCEPRLWGLLHLAATGRLPSFCCPCVVSTFTVSKGAVDSTRFLFQVHGSQCVSESQSELSSVAVPRNRPAVHRLWTSVAGPNSHQPDDYGKILSHCQYSDEENC